MLNTAVRQSSLHDAGILSFTVSSNFAFFPLSVLRSCKRPSAGHCRQQGSSLALHLHWSHVSATLGWCYQLEDTSSCKLFSRVMFNYSHSFKYTYSMSITDISKDCKTTTHELTNVAHLRYWFAFVGSTCVCIMTYVVWLCIYTSRSSLLSSCRVKLSNNGRHS